MGQGSSTEEEFIPPIFPTRKKTYDEKWVCEVRNKTIVTDCTIECPRSGGNESSTPSFEKLKTLVQNVKDLYETTNRDNHAEKLKTLFACLGQVWAGFCLVSAIVDLCAKEKDDFDALNANIEKKFIELRARDSVIRIRGYIWEIERLLNRPSNPLSCNELDKNVNFLMQELMVEGSTSALEEIYAYLDGGHRMQMERYILHVLHFLFNGMSKNNEMLLKELGQTKFNEYIKKQYGPDKQQKIVNNICKILKRFEEQLDTNLEKDFNKHYKRGEDFHFLTSKYDWLHFHLTTMHVGSCGSHSQGRFYLASNFTAHKLKSVRNVALLSDENVDYILHYISKDIWIDPTDDEISSARRALTEARRDIESVGFFGTANRHVLMAKRLNQHNLAWWGSFYGHLGAQFEFSNGYPTKCSVMEFFTPAEGYEWRVLLCGRK